MMSEPQSETVLEEQNSLSLVWSVKQEISARNIFRNLLKGPELKIVDVKILF